MSVKIQWSKSGWQQVFKSDEVGNALYRSGIAVAKTADSVSEQYSRSGRTHDRYNARTKKLANSQIAIVHPASRDGRALAAKHPNILLEAANRTNVNL